MADEKNPDDVEALRREVEQLRATNQAAADGARKTSRGWAWAVGIAVVLAVALFAMYATAQGNNCDASRTEKDIARYC